MLHRFHLGTIVLAIIGTLLAGCGSHLASKPSPPAQAKTGSPIAGTSEKVVASNSSSDTPADKAAEAHAHYAQGVILDMQDEPEKAMEEYSKSAIADPANEELILELTRRYIQLKETEKALEVLIRATALPDASGALYARLGMVYSRLGKDDQAIQASEKAVQKSPQSITGYQNLLLIYLQKNRPEDATKVLEKAAKQPKTDAEFLIDLGELYVNLQRQAPSQREATLEATRSVLNRAKELNPTNQVLRMKLADGLYVVGDTTNAVQIYLQQLNRFQDRSPVQDEIRAKLADIYIRNKEVEKAAEQLRAIVQSDPANAQADHYLGSLAYDQKKFPEAADYFQKTILLNEKWEPAYYDLAGVQINMDKANEALSTLERARQKFKPGFVQEFFTGLAYSKLKDYTNSLTHFTSAELFAKTEDPKRLTALFFFQVGSVQERAGNLTQAEEYFQKCLALSGDFSEALNYLAYMWAEKGVKLDKALEMIEKAVKLEPKNAAYLDSYAWVLYKLNRPKEALDQIQKALEFIEAPDATLYDHLGDIHTALKQEESARAAWRKSLEVEPNDAVRKKLWQDKAVK